MTAKVTGVEETTVVGQGTGGGLALAAMLMCGCAVGIVLVQIVRGRVKCKPKVCGKGTAESCKVQQTDESGKADARDLEAMDDAKLDFADVDLTQNQSFKASQNLS
jgi:hypothetical protein